MSADVRTIRTILEKGAGAAADALIEGLFKVMRSVEGLKPYVASASESRANLEGKDVGGRKLSAQVIQLQAMARSSSGQKTGEPSARAEPPTLS